MTVSRENLLDPHHTKAAVETLRAEIQKASYATNYDHRPLLTDKCKAAWPHMMEDIQLRYSRFKYAITQVLEPKTVYEIGIGWGVSANAFYAGKPNISFFGVDNDEIGLHPSEVLPIDARFQIVCTDDLKAFEHPDGPIDLIHIDGGHGYDQKSRDIVKAIEARPEWLLVDDVHNAMVAAGTFRGLYQASQAGLSMMYFGDSHTGNLLVHTARKEPELRAWVC